MCTYYIVSVSLAAQIGDLDRHKVEGVEVWTIEADKLRPLLRPLETPLRYHLVKWVWLASINCSNHCLAFAIFGLCESLVVYKSHGIISMSCDLFCTDCFCLYLAALTVRMYLSSLVHDVIIT